MIYRHNFWRKIGVQFLQNFLRAAMHHACALGLSCEGDDHFICLLAEELEKSSLSSGECCEPIDDHQAHMRSCSGIIFQSLNGQPNLTLAIYPAEGAKVGEKTLVQNG